MGQKAWKLISCSAQVDFLYIMFYFDVGEQSREHQPRNSMSHLMSTFLMHVC
jgi:hypothetical protein